MKKNWVKYILSYLFPIVVGNAKTKMHDQLQLLMVNGKWQLTSKSAIYSFEDKYLPLQYAIPQITIAKQYNRLLIVGFGVGSAINIIQKNHPNTDFEIVAVEPDEMCIEWAKKIWQSSNYKIEFINQTGEFYFESKPKYLFDIIVLDAFIELEVPTYFYTKECAISIIKYLQPNGQLIFNTISNGSEKDWVKNYRALFNTFIEIKIFKNVVWLGKNDSN
jgi:spermidine synthase